LVVLDAVLLFAGTTIAALLRWGAPAGSVKVGGLDYYAIAALIAAVWLALLASTHSYDARYLGIGSDEFRRVADAAIRVTAVVMFVTFVGKLPLSRGFVALALPIGLLSTLAGHYASAAGAAPAAAPVALPASGAGRRHATRCRQTRSRTESFCLHRLSRRRYMVAGRW
jgi:hypothetical protein